MIGPYWVNLQTFTCWVFPSGIEMVFLFLDGLPTVGASSWIWVSVGNSKVRHTSRHCPGSYIVPYIHQRFATIAVEQVCSFCWWHHHVRCRQTFQDNLFISFVGYGLCGRLGKNLGNAVQRGKERASLHQTKFFLSKFVRLPCDYGRNTNTESYRT